jgi:hypothetical protein
LFNFLPFENIMTEKEKKRILVHWKAKNSINQLNLIFALVQIDSHYGQLDYIVTWKNAAHFAAQIDGLNVVKQRNPDLYFCIHMYLYVECWSNQYVH